MTISIPINAGKCLLIGALAAISLTHCKPKRSVNSKVQSKDMTPSDAKVKIADAHGDTIIIKVAYAWQREAALLHMCPPKGMLLGSTLSLEQANWDETRNFNVIPETIDFAEFFNEACDLNIKLIEEAVEKYHKDPDNSDLGDSTLPGLIWCPWTTNILEVDGVSAEEHCGRSEEGRSGGNREEPSDDDIGVGN